MDLAALDMDPSATPANEATSLGTTESCARINENNVLDGDEDSIDGLQVDVTATNIPQSTAMIGFAYTIGYSEANLTIALANLNFLLVQDPNSSPLNGSEPLPDTDGNDYWNAAVADIGPGEPEYGSGVLHRLLTRSDATAAAGVYLLRLSPAAHVDSNNQFHTADSAADGRIAIGTDCPAAIQNADVQVTGVTLTSPASVTVGTAFTVTGGAALHNNGPADPAGADVS